MCRYIGSFKSFSYFLQLEMVNQRSTLPFKFNHNWINEEGFRNLVIGNWKIYEELSGVSTM
jgi:hypothetical protein